MEWSSEVRLLLTLSCSMLLPFSAAAEQPFSQTVHESASEHLELPHLSHAFNTALSTYDGALAVVAQEEQAGSSAPVAEDAGVPGGDRLGEAPDEDFRRVFLRESLVLLQPGETQLEFSLEYLRDQFSNVRTRAGSLRTTARVGLPGEFEVFLEAPFSWHEQEVFVVGPGSTVREIADENSGIGDISAGLNFEIAGESADWPSILGTVSYTEPTGEEPDLDGPLAAVLGPGSIALSQGRRNATGGLTFVRSSDPGVLFGGLYFTYFDKESLGGIEIEDGHLFIYRFGTGFAVNDQLTLSGLFTGAFRTKTKLNGKTVPQSDVEPLALRVGITHSFSTKRYIEPSVIFGLNEDAADAVLNVAYIVTF